MRRSQPGSIQAAIRKAYDVVGGLENVSTDIGVSETTLSYGTSLNEESRPGGLGVNYLDRLGRMHAEAAAVIAQHFAALAGGVFQPIETAGDSCLFRLSADAPKELGEAGSAIVRAAQAAATNPEDEVREIDEAIALLVRARAAIVSPGVTPIARAG